jgi:tetratricopeptide (TPR) repeat protein
MKHSCHTFFRSTLFLLVVSLFSTNTIQAHVTEKNMPDAIAEVEYRILLEFQPENIEVRNKLAMVLYRLDKLDDAVTELQRVLDMEPDNFEALDTLGLVRFKRGETRQALEHLEAAVRISSEDLFVHYHLGLVQAELGLLGAAEISLVTALKKIRVQKKQAGDDSETVLIEKALAEVRSQKATQ